MRKQKTYFSQNVSSGAIFKDSTKGREDGWYLFLYRNYPKVKASIKRKSDLRVLK